MLSLTYTAALFGIDAFMVTVECNTKRALPLFEIVGLPGTSVKESKQRIMNCAFPPLRSGTPTAPGLITVFPFRRYLLWIWKCPQTVSSVSSFPVSPPI